WGHGTSPLRVARRAPRTGPWGRRLARRFGSGTQWAAQGKAGSTVVISSSGVGPGRMSGIAPPARPPGVGALAGPPGAVPHARPGQRPPAGQGSCSRITLAAPISSAENSRQTAPTFFADSETHALRVGPTRHGTAAERLIGFLGP